MTAGSVLGLALDIRSSVTADISKIQDITRLIAQMLRLTSRFTVEMREIMSKLLQAFLGYPNAACATRAARNFDVKPMSARPQTGG